MRYSHSSLPEPVSAYLILLLHHEKVPLSQTSHKFATDKVPYQNSLSYNVNTTIDLNPNNVFYLRLYSGNFSSDSYIESHMFEIVKAANTSTVYSTVTATPTEALATITEQVAQTTGDPPKTAAATSGNPIASTSAADYGGLASVGRAVMGLTLGTGMGLILL